MFSDEATGLDDISGLDVAPIDRFLPLRTLIAMMLAGLSGYLLGKFLTYILLMAIDTNHFAIDAAVDPDPDAEEETTFDIDILN